LEDVKKQSVKEGYPNFIINKEPATFAADDPEAYKTLELNGCTVKSIRKKYYESTANRAG